MKFFKLTNNPSTLSDNFKVGDKVFFDTLYEFQEDDLGFNYDRGILKEIKHWPSDNREYYIVQTDDGKLLQVGNIFHTEEEKDAFTNNWMNPKFEKESAITQPNKPKPTTMLPDNMQWAWDPDAADWVAVLKDNSNTTPPLYDPNNQNVVNQTTNYMSNIKSASVINGEEDEDPLSVKLSDLFLSDSSLVDSYIKKEISCNDILDILGIEIKNKNEYKEVCNYIKEFIEDNYIIKSSSNKIQSALKLEDLRDINGKTPQEGMWLYCPMMQPDFRGKVPLYLFQVKVRHSRNGVDTPYLESKNGGYTKGITYVKKGILFDTYEEAEKYRQEHLSTEEKEYENMSTWDKVKHQLEIYKKSASCLSEFLDGPRYSKEIKIEAGLIKEGLVKYAGFDFNRGTKYIITAKGLEVLRKASEKEHNEALNEREKLAYMFGFNTDEVSTLDTTGKVIKSEEVTDEQLEESWNKYYPLYLKDVEQEKMTEENYPIHDEVAQNLKTLLSMHLRELKRYRKAIPIMKYHTNAKMRKAVEDGHSKGLSEDEITKQVDDIAEEYYKKENKIKPTIGSSSENYLKSFIFNVIKNKKLASLNKFAKKWNIFEADGTPLGKVTAGSELDAKVKFGIEHPEYADSQSICVKEVKSYYKDHDYLKEIKDDYYNGKLSLGDAAAMLYEYGYYNYIPSEERTKKDLGLLKDAKYEETIESHEPYPNPSETPHDDIVLENHDGWVNTADNHFEYTEEQKRLLPLFKLVNQYVLRKEAIISEDVQNDDGFVVSGVAEIINDLEHKIKDLGFYCEPVAEIVDNSYIGKDIYSLRVFEK